VPVPLPVEPRLGPPDEREVRHLLCGIVSAAAPSDGLTSLQQLVIEATFDAMTGFTVVCSDASPIDPESFAEGLADRDRAFRTRILQVALLAALVLRPLPSDVAERVEAFARALCVDDDMLLVARRYASGQLGLAQFDFQRNGYTASWSPERATALHTSRELADAWELSLDDPALAARWRALADLPDGTLGRGVADFYRARGFAYPGLPDSAPPLLAQHDWVHVLADYGSTVESELEVFALIARANDDPKGFSLLAMVVSLFETGYLRSGAGLFEASPGQLSHEGVAVRVADAMRRGALAHTATSPSVDFLAVDWFDLAHLSLGEARTHFGLPPKSRRAVEARSAGPFAPGGISPYQERHGREAAAAVGRAYESFGATPPSGPSRT
jgi:hypothetical protein